MQLPNILVCGTPGTGKSSTCAAFMEETAVTYPGFRHIDVSNFVKENAFHEGYDDVRKCHIIDEDKVCDELEELMSAGGIILDTHAMIDFFPERWFDLVVVLATDNTVLFDRLAKRGYDAKKVSENVECEIMQVVRTEAQSSYAAEMVQILKSDTIEELEMNVRNMSAWVNAWVANNPQ